MIESAQMAAAELRAGLEETTRSLVDAYERQDAAALARCYTPDGTVVGPERDLAQGRDEIEASARRLMGAVRFSNARSDLLECEAFGGTAYTLSRFSVDVHPRDDGTAQRQSWTTFTLWKLEPSGHWRIHRRMSDAPQRVGGRTRSVSRWGRSIRP